MLWYNFLRKKEHLNVLSHGESSRGGSLLIISVKKGGRTEVQDGPQEGSEVASR